MNYIDLTLPTPEENLALDEYLLDSAEAGRTGEILRFWEPSGTFVVLGYSRRLASDVHVDACRRDNVPILRRFSGGGTVLQGPGCLNFTLVLKTEEPSPFQNITQTNRIVMERHRWALQRLIADPVRVQGITDLTLGPLKFSGNAQRRGRRHTLFHGSFLHRFDIAAVERYLCLPDKQPAYRRNRPHATFLTNLPLSARQIKQALRLCWKAEEQLRPKLNGRLAPLATRHRTSGWINRF
ncbi:MAG: lipoate--protein ligase family protein [Candidatus Omnitrophica bacterium]|nr:lipoate--protein ligase family protein [Candidatus Omnitrophota bacterium]